MKRIITSLCVVLLCSEAGAQNSRVVDELYHDFSNPDISAYGMLGINPEKVIRPSSPKELVASILNLSAEGKNISPAFALEWSPGQTFSQERINNSFANLWQSYRNSRPLRQLNVSFATHQDSIGSKVALGISYCFYDHSDPSRDQNYFETIALLSKQTLRPLANIVSLRTDYTTIRVRILGTLGVALPAAGVADDADFSLSSGTAVPARAATVAAIAAAAGIGPGNPAMTDVEALADAYTKALTAYRTQIANDAEAFSRIIKEQKESFKQQNWNAGILKIGLGNIWNSPDYTWKQLQNHQFTGYLSLATRFPTSSGWFHTHSQFVGLLQFNYNYNDSSTDASQTIAGGRILLGSNKVHGSIEGVYQKNTYKASGDKIAQESVEKLRSTLGIELRMSDGLWLELATGFDGPSTEFWKNAGMIGFANVKYAFKKEARHNIP